VLARQGRILERTRKRTGAKRQHRIRTRSGVKALRARLTECGGALYTLPMNIKHLLLSCALALSVGGCSSMARGMRAETSPKYAPAAGTATLVFVRHSNFGGAINFVAVDQNKKFVAALRGPQHAITQLTPGEYTFYVVSENTDVIKATVEAGRTYVIETRVRPGFMKAQVTAESVRRDTPRFSEALTWIRETPALVPADTDGQAWVDDHADNIQKRIAKVDTNFEKKPADWQDQHTLRPEDGYTSDEFKLD
jgi:hypothetical protein